MKVTQAQIAWFRLRRSGLIEPLDSPEAVAARLLGVQAQMLPGAQQAIRARTANATLEDVERGRLDNRSLVRLWGQRNTAHLYHADDWPLLQAAFQDQTFVDFKRFEKSGHLRHFRKLVGRARKRLAAGEQLSYADAVCKTLSRHHHPQAIAYSTFLALVREGTACFGAGEGGSSRFVHRSHWLPQLDWAPPEKRASQSEVAVRYLTAYGPAEIADVAFWAGTSLGEARRWIADAGERVAAFAVAGREYLCRAEDVDELARLKPPPAARWPVRLLYRFDPLLLATKDKSWLIDAQHYKEIWQASAHVAAAILVKGRIAGTWRYERKGQGLSVELAPFAALSASQRSAAKREAARVAEFLEVALAKFEG